MDKDIERAKQDIIDLKNSMHQTVIKNQTANNTSNATVVAKNQTKQVVAAPAKA